MSEARTFSPRLIAGIVAAGIVAFGAFVLLLAFGGSLSNGRDGRAHALSNSAVGFSGLVRLLDDRGEVRLLRGRSDLRTEDLVVVAVEPTTDPEELATFLNGRGSRATLLILPKWATVQDRRRPGWVQWGGVGFQPRIPKIDVRTQVDTDTRGGQLARSAPRTAPAAVAPPGGTDRPPIVTIEPSEPPAPELLRGISPPVPAMTQTITGKNLQPLLTTPGGDILVARVGGAPLYVVADPDLLNNHGIANRERAWAAVRMIEELNATGAEAVRFDLSLNGFGSAEGRNLLRLMFEPPFLVMTLALVAAAFLAGFHGLYRFGPARAEERAIAFGKAALVENSAGLIRLAKRELRLGGAYVEVVRQEAARITAAPRELTGEALDDYLNRFSAPGAPNFGELAGRLRSAGDRDNFVSAARALSSWKEELIK